ncbi:hypothetical protein CEXT_58871 [Caerostris extrusa]|uniref:Uncharacterized protein n=1 Tax=Caerostris extrusa TaxID=172846 RepID=A0AAV4QSE7_CAEEX|nr:hypothetical protein CEXT_58871 [Caerostris extrusa]
MVCASLAWIFIANGLRKVKFLLDVCECQGRYRTRPAGGISKGGGRTLYEQTIQLTQLPQVLEWAGTCNDGSVVLTWTFLADSCRGGEKPHELVTVSLSSKRKRLHDSVTMESHRDG